MFVAKHGRSFSHARSPVQVCGRWSPTPACSAPWSWSGGTSPKSISTSTSTCTAACALSRPSYRCCGSPKGVSCSWPATQVRRRGSANILLICHAGNIGGLATATWNNVYSMTKHAVIALGDGLRREMMKWGISVCLVEPTYYKTAILPKPEAIIKKYHESNLPQEVKDAYGDDYVTEMAQISVDTMALFARDNVDEVVDTMEKAVCSRHPRQMYRCDGFVRWLLVVVFLCFPLVFQDLLDYTFLHYHSLGPDGKLVMKPSVLERLTNKIKSILAPQKLKK
ncbi:hypothetical protein V5799_010669 [Amblyomma americanum]|uniref:Uncharacterized protein n=1 Tax=Amblyomma americanum TaxID=6943 RepID=A0AAQ4EJ16_AMBAM